MSALPALEPEHGDTDGGGDPLAVFIMLLTLHVARRGPLISAALRADIQATLAELTEKEN